MGKLLWRIADVCVKVTVIVGCLVFVGCLALPFIGVVQVLKSAMAG